MAPEPIDCVPGDPKRFRKLLSKLITNAIRYSHGAGRIWVESEKGPGCMFCFSLQAVS